MVEINKWRERGVVEKVESTSSDGSRETNVKARWVDEQHKEKS